MIRGLSFGRLSLLFILTFTAWSAAAAPAAMLALTAPVTATPAPSDGYTVGYEFLTGPNPLFVTALGVWDQANPAAPGLLEAHEIAIWNSGGGTPLVDQIIGPSGTNPLETQDNAWLFVPLSTRLMLAPNTLYVIGVFDGTGVEFYHGSQVSTATPVFNTPDVTFVERRLDSDADAASQTFAFPFRSLGAGSAWDMPNFAFVPEPASLSLLILGGAAAAARRRGH